MLPSYRSHLKQSKTISTDSYLKYHINTIDKNTHNYTIESIPDLIEAGTELLLVESYLKEMPCAS